MKQIGASATLPLVSMMRDSVSAPDRASYCLKAARIMYGCYRKSDAYDPEVFAGAAAAVLTEYELRIVDFVTDPRTGLPSRLKWPPEIKEVRDACDEIVRDEAAKGLRDSRLRQQFKDREEFEAEQRARGKRLTRAEMIEKGLIQPRASERPLPAQELWAKWIVQRMMPGIVASAETRHILELAGYVVDGPSDQKPGPREEVNHG